MMKNIRRRPPSLARGQRVADLPVQREGWSARASPPRHTATVAQQLLFFSNHSLLVSWLIIHHLRGRQRAFMYTTPVAVFIRRVSGLPQHFHVCPLSRGGELQAASRDSRLAIVCGARCLQFPQCSFVFSSNESISVRFWGFFCLSLKTYLS